jgi:hypothetical protein
MTQFIAHDAAGRVQFACTIPDVDGAPAMTPIPRMGLIYRPWPGTVNLVAPTPSSEQIWIDGEPRWVEAATIDQARENAWAAAKAERDKAEAADFEYGGVLYQPDVAKITGAVLAALLPRPTDAPPFSIDWTVSDNSVVTLDASQVIGLGLTLTARINAIHQQGRTLRALIDNATTPQEAYGHTWDSLNAD